MATESRIGPARGLEFDRISALYSADGQWIIGKSTPAINQIRAVFSPTLDSVTLSRSADLGAVRWRQRFLSLRKTCEEVGRPLIRPQTKKRTVQKEIDSIGSHVVATTADERDQISKSRQQETMLATVSGVFGGLIVVLAALGLAGFCNYILALRTRELAIRAGLGAGPRQIAGTLLRETVVVVITGSLIGLSVTLTIQRFVNNFIAIDGSRYWSPIEAVLIMTVITAVATLIPTMRALRMDIAQALRME